MTGRNINWVTLAKQHVVSTRTWGALTKKWCPLSTMGTWGDGEIRKQGKLRQLLWHKIQLNDCFVNFRYFEGIQRNLNLMPIVYPGWIMRLYVESRCLCCSKKVLCKNMGQHGHQNCLSDRDSALEVACSLELDKILVGVLDICPLSGMLPSEIR